MTMCFCESKSLIIIIKHIKLIVLLNLLPNDILTKHDDEMGGWGILRGEKVRHGNNLKLKRSSEMKS